MKAFGINIEIIVILLVILWIINLALLIIMLKKNKKTQKNYDEFMRGSDARSLEEVFKKRLGQIDELVIRDMTRSEDVKNIYDTLSYTLQKIGIVKYDAFNEMGGKLSFCLTLLDRDNNGVILNSMQGREGSYLYIKEILDGKSAVPLGKEEEISLRKAIYTE
jgi:hypothetical protein